MCSSRGHDLAEPVWVVLQVGFDASGLEGLQMHHIVVNTWEHGVDSEQVQYHNKAWQSCVASQAVLLAAHREAGACSWLTHVRACLQNVVLISIASVEDPSLAPPGKHTLHAYLPATEPFHLWEGEAAATQTPAASLQGIFIVYALLYAAAIYS